jgi:2-polyprenyl-6-methoxyphenol hydroxylase-like FAD-dependent oxidoreductase
MRTTSTVGVWALSSWPVRGRVVLIGDAAYCVSAMTGMGTTSGIASAYVLAGGIGRHCGGSSEKNFMEGMIP